MFNWFLLVQNVSKTAIDFDCPPRMNKSRGNRQRGKIDKPTLHLLNKSTFNMLLTGSYRHTLSIDRLNLS